MENQIDKKEIEIDLKQLVMELVKRIWIIVLVTAIAGVGALIISMFFIKPVYTSTTSVYILSKQSETAAVSYSDLQTASQLTSDYEQLIKSRDVAEKVITEMGLDTTVAALSSSISVSSPTGTRMLEISVNNGDPQLAQKIAAKTREVAGKQIVDIMNIDAVNLVDEANLPLTPSSPSVSRNTLLGAVVGFILACAAIILMYVLNDTIRTPEDIDRYLGMSVLGVIPVTGEVEKKYGPGKKNNGRGGKASRASAH